MPQPNVLGGSVLILELVEVLGKLQQELAVLVGDDGCLYLAHRFTPDILVAKIDLKTDPPTVEELDYFPGLHEEWLNLDKEPEDD